MGEDWTTYLLRYGELGIKGPGVRRHFEDRLVANIKGHFARAGATGLVRRAWGRLFLETPDERTARHAITHTFGLVSGSPATITKPTIEDINAELTRLAPRAVRPGQTFAIRPRRTGNQKFTSMDVGVKGGGAVLSMVPTARVDLTRPEVELHVEVRDDAAYVFTETIAGPGGLPLGSQGRAVVAFTDARAAAAAWLVMRRGATVLAVVPERAAAAVDVLTPWAPGLRVTEIEGAPSRATLLAVCERVAHRSRGAAVVVPDADILGNEKLSLPILRPLGGLPQARWPAHARDVARAAERAAPGSYVDETSTASAQGLLGGARRRKL